MIMYSNQQGRSEVTHLWQGFGHDGRGGDLVRCDWEDGREYEMPL